MSARVSALQKSAPSGEPPRGAVIVCSRPAGAAGPAIVELHDGQGAHAPLRHDFVYYGAGAFDFGDESEAAAELALNVLILVTATSEAWRHHAAFAAEVIARLPHPGGSIPVDYVRRWVRQHPAAAVRPA